MAGLPVASTIQTGYPGGIGVAVAAAAKLTNWRAIADNPHQRRCSSRTPFL